MSASSPELFTTGHSLSQIITPHACVTVLHSLITITNYIIYIMCQTQVGCPAAVGPSESPRLETTQEKKDILADQQLGAKHFNLFLG
jgi:hypothetical protein